MLHDKVIAYMIKKVVEKCAICRIFNKAELAFGKANSFTK